jgi:EAL domain-containing protein (putative c-di-GMP-specific phosphodiesterase class I)
VFEHACRSMAQQGRQDGFLTINVSNLHLRHVEFERRLVALLDDPERVRSTLERLRRAGIGAALDDFGTGYSSLSYLHSLPLRMLKIDRSFVQALDSGVRATRTVVAAILALARALDIEVVAEGIETPAQRAALVNMGCELGQGYLLGRPQAVRHRHHSGHEGLPLAAG